MGRKFIIVILAISAVVVGLMAFLPPGDRGAREEQMVTLVEQGANAPAGAQGGMEIGEVTPPPPIATPPAAVPDSTPQPALIQAAETTPTSTPASRVTTTPGKKSPEGTPWNELPRVTSTPTPSPTPAPTANPKATSDISGKPLRGRVIGIDAGHQAKSNKETEPVAPNSTEMKAKVSSGTYGRFTGTLEHVVNLNVAMHLKPMLEAAGATVVMVRETADVDISNIQRAEIFNNAKVDLGVRIHCNGSTDRTVTGAFMLIPKESPYRKECEAAAKCVLSEYGRVTGIGIKKGITIRSDQTGFNWCTRPVVNIEMGHMTNEEEDRKLSNLEFQKTMARGIFEGVLKYFREN